MAGDFVIPSASASARHIKTWVRGQDSPTMIQVQTPARLHFGLLNVGVPEAWSTIDGEQVIPARQFGGVGMMINEPALKVRVEHAGEWSASGPMAERALAFARDFAATIGELPPHQIHVTTEAIPHAGFG